MHGFVSLGDCAASVFTGGFVHVSERWEEEQVGLEELVLMRTYALNAQVCVVAYVSTCVCLFMLKDEG